MVVHTAKPACNGISRDPQHFRFRRISMDTYEGWNFNGGNYLFTTDTK